jgi:hypothetical protein
LILEKLEIRIWKFRKTKNLNLGDFMKAELIQNQFSAEYFYLKKKIIKILKKGKFLGNRKLARAQKQTNKFRKRIKEIEKYLRENGLPHPEAKSNNQINGDLVKDHMKVGRPILTTQDGTLFKKDFQSKDDPFGIMNSKSANPDGTLFETPVLEGAVLNSNLHNPEKIQEFLENQNKDE